MLWTCSQINMAKLNQIEHFKYLPYFQKLCFSKGNTLVLRFDTLLITYGRG